MGIGSSVAALVMGLYPASWGRSITELYDELTGAIPPIETNEAMQWGTDHEPEARALVNKQLELSYQPVCVVHHQYAELRASLDGYDEHASPPVLEIKCPRSKALLTKALDPKGPFIPPYYFAQVQHILNVTGESEVRFRVHYATPAGRKDPETADIVIPAHKAFIERLQRRELDFWENVVYRQRPLEPLSLVQRTTIAERAARLKQPEELLAA